MRFQHFTSAAAFLIATVLIAGCDDDSGSGGTVIAPTGLTYTNPVASYETCETVLHTATVVTGTPLVYSVAPILPTGLSLNVNTGEISGNPTLPATQANYTVTVTNALGSDSEVLTLTVVDAPDPAALSYSADPALYTTGTPIVPNTPTVTGQITGWTVAPALPAGLTLSTTTGVITGTPSAVSAATNYTITASNCESQSTNTLISIEVQQGGGGTGNEPRFVYVSNSGDGTVSTLTINDTTGETRPFGYTYLGGTPSALERSSDNTELFVADSTGNQVRIYSINNSTGVLSETAGSPVSTGSPSGPQDLLMNSVGDVLYVANRAGQTVSAYSVAGNGDLAALTGSPFGVGGTQPTALALSPDGDFLFVANFGSDQISVFDVAVGGELSGEQLFATGNEPVGLDLATSSSGVLALYVGTATGQTLESYAVNPATGALLAIGAALNIGGNVGFVRTAEFAGAATRVIYLGNTSDDRIQRHSIVASGQATISVDDTWVGTDPLAVVLTDDQAAAVGLFAGENAISSGTVDDVNVGALTTVEPNDRRRVRSSPSDVLIINAAATGVFATDTLYTANFNAADISQFAFSPAGPSLTALVPSTVAAGSFPGSIALHPTLAKAYVTDASGSTTDSVLAFDVDVAGGLTGTPVSSDVPGDGSVLDLAVDPSGRFLFAVRSSTVSEVITYTIDAAGALTFASGAAAGNVSRGCIVDPTGRFLYVTNSLSDNDVRGYTIDPQTGALTAFAADTPTDVAPFDLTIETSGRFCYVANRGSSTVSSFTIDANTGALTVLNASPVSVGASAGPGFLIASPNGRNLYVAAESGQNIRRFAININEGNATADGTLNGAFPDDTAVAGDPRELAFDATGGTLFASLSDTGEVLTFSTDVSGDLTLQDTDAAGGPTGSSRGLAVRDRLP